MLTDLLYIEEDEPFIDACNQGLHYESEGRNQKHTRGDRQDLKLIEEGKKFVDFMPLGHSRAWNPKHV